jgi:acyl-CoA reductase-like NAD-dependent aldehyde dehydrogenase
MLISRSQTVPSGVLSVLPGGAAVGKALVENPLIKKVDITVGVSPRCEQGPSLTYVLLKAGTQAGRSIGSIVGRNLASFTAELGGKVCTMHVSLGVVELC